MVRQKIEYCEASCDVIIYQRCTCCDWSSRKTHDIVPGEVIWAPGTYRDTVVECPICSSTQANKPEEENVYDKAIDRITRYMAEMTEVELRKRVLKLYPQEIFNKFLSGE